MRGQADEPLQRPPPSRWTSFVVDERRRGTLHEPGNPSHRLRTEHNRDTILIHLSDEDGRGWTSIAVDRATRQVAVAAARTQSEAAAAAFELLYPTVG